MSLSSIPKDFGAGGANIGDGNPKLAAILEEHRAAIEAGGSGTDTTARAAAATAQTTANGAVTVNSAQNIELADLLNSRNQLEQQSPGSGAGIQRVGIGFFPDAVGLYNVENASTALRMFAVQGLLKNCQLFDEDVTHSVADGSLFIIGPSNLTTNRTLTVNISGLQDKEIIRVVRFDLTGNTLAVDGGAGVLYTFPGDGFPRMVQFKLAGGVLTFDHVARLFDPSGFTP